MHNSLGPYARKIQGNSPRKILTNPWVTDQLKLVMQETYGESKSGAKEAAEDAASSPRAAENWMAGENPMGLTAFLNAYHTNPTFKAWAKKLLLMEEDHDPEFQAQLAAFIRAVQKVPT